MGKSATRRRLQVLAYSRGNKLWWATTLSGLTTHISPPEVRNQPRSINLSNNQTHPNSDTSVFAGKKREAGKIGQPELELGGPGSYWYCE